MKKLFTLFFCCTLPIYLFGQIPEVANLPYSGSFESAEGYLLDAAVNKVTDFSGNICTTSSFWEDCFSSGEKATTVTVVSDAADGQQALRIDVGPGTSDLTTGIRLRTPSYVTDGVYLYDNSKIIKFTCMAKTDAAGVALGNATGGIMGLRRGELTVALTEAYQEISIYGKLANNRIQIWLQDQEILSTDYSIWLDKVTVEEVESIPIEPAFATFPYTESFESDDYNISGTPFAYFDGTDGTNNWLTTAPQVFQDFWKGTATNGFAATVDGDAYEGSKAIKLAIAGLADEGFWLRTVPVPAGEYTISFYAKTDVAGITNGAQLGFQNDPNTMINLTTEYVKYENSVTAQEGNNKLLFLYTGYNTNNITIWLDNITIQEGVTTGVEKVKHIDVVQMYPNPVVSHLFIEAGGTIENVEVFNLSGQKIKDIKSEARGYNLTNLKPGIYIAVVTVDGQKRIRKFLKK